MTVSNEKLEFFTKLSKIWQNFKDYSYLEGINLSQEQINIIEHDEEQLLIEGFAGTGKSLTLLYKFINVLIREENKRILYVTYNSTLIEDVKKRLNTCAEYNENKDRHDVNIQTFHEMAASLLKEIKVIDRGIGKLSIENINKKSGDVLRRIAGIHAKYTEARFDEYKSLSKEEKLYSTHDMNFVKEEITWLKAMGFTTLDKYLSTERIGRSKRIRLTRSQRKTIFKIYEEYQKDLSSNKYGLCLDLEDYALKILEKEYEISDNLKFDYVFVDEMQDLDPMQILALCKLTKKSIILSGDAKQRIYKKCPVKYEELGLQIKQKGRRKVLRKNYRSTAQIVKLANSLNFYDNEDKLSEKQFVKEGERPVIHRTKDSLTAAKYIAEKIKKIHAEDSKKTIAIINREEIKQKTGYKSDFRLYLESQLIYHTFTDINTYYKRFDNNKEKQVFYTNPYDVKGLEFDIVFIIDFNRRYYPNFKELNKVVNSNESNQKELLDDDILEFINIEKKLLYVAMSRAKEELYLIANGCQTEKQISEFIFDFNSKDYVASGFTKSNIELAKVHYNNVGNGKLFVMKEKEIQEKIKDEFTKKMEALRENEKEEKETLNKIKEIPDTNDYSSNILMSNVKIFESDNDNTILKQMSLNINDKLEESFEVKEEKVKIDIIDSTVKPLLSKHKIRFVDKRSKGGAFWIIAGMEISDLVETFNSYGLKLSFIKNGGRSTGHKAAWYTK